MQVKEAPPIYRQLLSKFGKNSYGQNCFRLIWEPSRMRIFGGYWDDLGKWEYRLVQKYGTAKKWILERWRPAVVYGSPELWEQQTGSADGWLTCGPFPVHGDFECISKFAANNPAEEGILPEPGLVLYTVMEHRLGQVIAESDRKRVYEDDALRKERESDQKFDDMWAEAQLTRPGLTLGAGGAFNKQQEIDDYARRIEKANAYVNARRFAPGFRQQ